MSDNPIARIVHLSDLHFGEQLVNREEWWHRVCAPTPVQGRYTHDYQAVRALERILHEITEQATTSDLPLLLVHTGDLTASGKQLEFQTGQSFLSRLGTVHQVPGNHDKWDFAAGKPPVHYQAHFLSLESTPSCEGRVIFFRIDTNRHTQPFWDATGAVEPSSLAAICSELARHPDAIRIVLMHHPLSVAPAHDNKQLRLDNRETIAQTLADAGADLVLTGHVHVSQYEPQPYPPLHFIAGSATQMGGPKSFLVIDVYPTGFDVQQYSIGPDNHFRSI